MLTQSKKNKTKTKKKKVKSPVKRAFSYILFRCYSYFKVSLKTPMAIAVAGGADSGKVN